jgi:hypothetical protein
MAQFRTAAGQYILPIDATVAVDLYPGDLVKLTPGTPNAITKASGLSDATHMVALTDETVGGSYVPVDLKVYKPTGKVAASTTTAKRVGLYPIFDKNDIIV